VRWQIDREAREFAAEDPRARLRLGSRHQRKLGRDPFFHPNHEARGFAGGVFDHQRAFGKFELGIFDAEGREGARIQP